MSESENTPPTNSTVEAALSQIPGLAEKVSSTGSKPATPDYLNPEGEDGEQEQNQDSDAVRAALNQIPGLKDRLDS